MLNIYEYFDEPKSLSLYDKVNNSMGYLKTSYAWGSSVTSDKLEPVLNVIKKSPELAYYYAKNIIEGRWPEGEPAIIKAPDWACMYARDIMHDRWIEAEPVIKTDDYWRSGYEYDFDVKL